MCSECNKQFLAKKICDAFHCYEVAARRVYISVRDKKISLDLCENCVGKFVDN